MAVRIDSAAKKDCAIRNRERSRWDRTPAAGSRQRISPVDRCAPKLPVNSRLPREIRSAGQLRSGVGWPAGTKFSETEFRQ